MADMWVKTQKVIKVGNSLAVTLDPKFLARHRINANTTYRVGYSGEEPKVTIGADLSKASGVSGSRPVTSPMEDKRAYLVDEVDQEFRDWVDRSLSEDAESLKELANK